GVRAREVEQGDQQEEADATEEAQEVEHGIAHGDQLLVDLQACGTPEVGEHEDKGTDAVVDIELQERTRQGGDERKAIGVRGIGEEVERGDEPAQGEAQQQEGPDVGVPEILRIEEHVRDPVLQSDGLGDVPEEEQPAQQGEVVLLQVKYHQLEGKEVHHP